MKCAQSGKTDYSTVAIAEFFACGTALVHALIADNHISGEKLLDGGRCARIGPLPTVVATANATGQSANIAVSQNPQGSSAR